MKWRRDWERSSKDAKKELLQKEGKLPWGHPSLPRSSLRPHHRTDHSKNSEQTLFLLDLLELTTARECILLDMISVFLTMLVKYFCYYFFMDLKQLFLHFLHLPVKIYSGLDRVINHVMHDSSLVELLCKICRYSSKSSFAFLVERFY